MSVDPRLHIWPRGANVDAVKEVVLALNLPYKVKPFWYNPAESENVARVLVLEDGFEHGTIVDYIYPKKPELVKESVEWALGIREESRGQRLAIDTMKRIFGEDLNMWEEVRMPDGWADV